MIAIILAAGFSKRFGREKLLIDIENRPMIEKIIELVGSIFFDEIILVYRDEEIKNTVPDKNIKYVLNNESEKGLSSSLKCGISNSGSTDGYIFFMGDQPYLYRDTIIKLIKAFKDKKGSIIVPKYCGQRGTPVIFAADWKTDLMNLSGDSGGRTIIEENIEKVYFVDIYNQKEGKDIDTPGDYESQK